MNNLFNFEKENDVKNTLIKMIDKRYSKNKVSNRGVARWVDLQEVQRYQAAG